MTGSFFNPSQYTDDELDQNISKLLNRSNYVRYSMNNNTLADQIESMIDSLMFEKEERALSQNSKNDSYIVYESDPDMALKQEDTTKTKSKKPSTKSFSKGPVIIKQKPKNI